MGILKEIASTYKNVNDLLAVAKNDSAFEKFLVSTDKSTHFNSKLAANFALVWDQFGKNSFNVSHGLAVGLLATDPLKNQTIKFPYPAYIMLLPDNLIPGVDQLWLSNTIPFEGAPVDSAVVTLIAHNAKENLVSYRYFSQTEFANPKDCIGENVEASVAHRHNLCQRLAYNFILYINSGAAKIEKKESIKSSVWKHLRSFQGCVAEWMIGNNVKISKELKDATNVLIVGTGPEVTGVTPQVRFMVRGHFRLQPFGFKRTLRKLIWIEPFMKGPEGAEAWAHIYQATSPKHSTLQA